MKQASVYIHCNVAAQVLSYAATVGYNDLEITLIWLGAE